MKFDCGDLVAPVKYKGENIHQYKFLAVKMWRLYDAKKSPDLENPLSQTEDWQLEIIIFQELKTESGKNGMLSNPSDLRR